MQCDRLEQLVQACLSEAEARGAAQAAAFLRANACRIEQRLRSLSAWAGGDSAGGPGPSAFELADAMDRLNAAARRRERDAAWGPA